MKKVKQKRAQNKEIVKLKCKNEKKSEKKKNEWKNENK